MGWGVQEQEQLLPGAACLGPRPVPLLSVTEEMSGVVTQCTDEPWNSSAHSSLLFVLRVLPRTTWSSRAMTLWAPGRLLPAPWWDVGSGDAY